MYETMSVVFEVTNDYYHEEVRDSIEVCYSINDSNEISGHAYFRIDDVFGQIRPCNDYPLHGTFSNPFSGVQYRFYPANFFNKEASLDRLVLKRLGVATPVRGNYHNESSRASSV